MSLQTIAGRVLLLTIILVLPVAHIGCSMMDGGTGDQAQAGNESQTAKKEHISGVRRALNLWAAQRAYPNRVIPDESLAAAFAEMQKMKPRVRSLDAAADPWELLGPYNIGGRTLCLALHPHDPDVIFAGSASGGLWKTTSGGVGADAWDYIDTGFPVLGVSTIAIDPADPDVMYIGTGEVYKYQDSIGGEVIRTTRGSYGIGILKSTDGGATWAKVLDWSYAQSRGVWMIAVNPLDSLVVYAATTEGVYRSGDAGATWELVLDEIMATDVRIHPTDPNRIFAACGNFASTGHGIYRSVDDGVNWQKLTSGLPGTWSGKVQLAIAPTAPNRIYASIADDFAGIGLYRSTDTGDTWSLVNPTDYQKYQGWYSHYVVVSPFDADDIFVGGIEIWGSTNGGNNLSRRSDWTEFYYGTNPPEGPIGGPNYAHADHHFAVWHPTDPDTVFFASDGGVFKTTDGGSNFQSLIGGLVTTQFYNGFSSSATDRDLAMGGMQDNFTAIYNGGPAWHRVIGGDGCWTAINAEDDRTIYGTAQYLYLVRSRDGGENWTNVEPPDQSGDHTAFVAPFVLSPSDPDILYAGRSHVYKSGDEGSNWWTTNNGQTLDGLNPILSMAISATDPDTVYAGTAPLYSRAKIFRTVDGGTTWNDITGPLPDLYPGDIAVDRNDPDRVLVAFMGYENEHVFRSKDGGATWIDVTDNLPDVPVSAVAIDPRNPRIVYAGTDLGVFVSTVGGGSWAPFMTGMPTAMVTDLTIFAPLSKRSRPLPGEVNQADMAIPQEVPFKIRASTHGNGVYERDLIRGR